MKVIREEFGEDYGNYRFGYCVWCHLEQDDELRDIYAGGFLPYSKNPEEKNTFYMARSARVTLSQFEPSSENRRIAKRFDGQARRELLTPAEAKTDPECIPMVLEYFSKKHGAIVMPENRLIGILDTPLPLRVVRYVGDAVLGYTFEIVAEGVMHFWYSAYDMRYAQKSLGAWLMLDSIRNAKSEGRAHAYLGTVYGEKGKYKMNFQPLEYWNGTEWIGGRERT